MVDFQGAKKTYTGMKSLNWRTLLEVEALELVDELVIFAISGKC